MAQVGPDSADCGEFRWSLVTDPASSWRSGDTSGALCLLEAAKGWYLLLNVLLQEGFCSGSKRFCCQVLEELAVKVRLERSVVDFLSVRGIVLLRFGRLRCLQAETADWEQSGVEEWCTERGMSRRYSQAVGMCAYVSTGCHCSPHASRKRSRVH